MSQALLQAAVPHPIPGPASGLDVRSFLEGLRRRLLHVTAGMRPGIQRLELAIEVCWYAALEERSDEGIPWASISSPAHPLRALLGPVRLMLRSELIHAGARLPDALIDDVLQQVLVVAENESYQGRRDPSMREDFTTWLRRRMRGVAGAHRDVVA